MVPETGAVGIALDRRQELRDAGDQRVHAGAGDRRAEEHRMHQRLPGLVGELGAEVAVGNRRRLVDVRRQKRVIVVGQQLGQPGS